MNRPKNLELTPLEMDKIAEYKTFRLQKQFRTMALDRDCAPEQIQQVLAKQKSVLDQLTREKEELISKISSCQNPAMAKRDARKLTQIHDLIEENHELNKKLISERQEMKEVEAKVFEFKMKLLRLKAGTCFSDDPEVFKKVEKSEENLENRLYSITVRYNTRLTLNAKLREDIDHMLKEREKFNFRFNVMMDKLLLGKRAVMELVEQCSWAYIWRDEALTMLEALRKKAKADLMANCIEMRDLKRVLDHEVKLFHFAGTKGAKRINVDIERIEYEKNLKARGNMATVIDYYRTVLKDIRSSLDESNLGRLVAAFLKREQDNFNIFSYINELNKELEAIREELVDYREKIVEERELIKNREVEQQLELVEIRQIQERETEETEKEEFKLNMKKQELTDLVAGVQDIFNFISCDTSYLFNLLGDMKVVTIFNINLYLETIEQRICDMFDLCYYLQYSPVAEKAAKIFPGKVSSLKKDIVIELPRPIPKFLPASQYINAQPCPLCHEKEEISEVDETIVMPYTNEEAKTYVADEMVNNEYFVERLHNVSACKLPKARLIVQKRNQN